MNILSRPSCGSLLRFLAASLWLLAWPLHALQVPQLDDTTWLLKGSAKLSSPQLGNESVKGYLLATFADTGVLALEDGAGYVINGSWSVDAEGLIGVVVSGQDVENFLYDNLPPSVASQIGDVDVTAISSSAKLKTKDGVGSLSFKLSFTLAFEVQGEPYSLTYKLSVKGKGDVSGQSPAGATWLLATDMRLKAGKIKLEGFDDLKLILGPDGGLPDNRFALRRQADDLELYSGYYTLVAGTLLLKPDADELEDYVESLITPNVAAFYPDASLYVFGVAPAFTGKIKNSVLKLKGKATILGSFDTYDPDTDETEEKFFKGSHALTGVGTE